MTDNNTDQLLEQRIYQTLQLAEERGYNLTIGQLSTLLIGAVVPEYALRQIIPTLKNIEIDSDFIATKGNLHLHKCQQRQQSNVHLQPYYQCIATKFINEYTRLCPWVTCMMISGSMASEGLGEGDDIDFDLIVPDGLKYTSYLLALLLSFKYSLILGKQFWRRYVICISVIWEMHQVLPFQRNDGQLAFELLNAKVVYNPGFFTHLVSKNEWLKNYFPQMYQRIDMSSHHGNVLPQEKKRLPGRFIEYVSKNILFLTVTIAMKTVFRDHNIRHRMMVKHPYALFDVPGK
jgi:hypothetical protein